MPPFRLTLSAARTAGSGAADPDCSQPASPGGRKLSQMGITRRGVTLTTGSALSTAACDASASFNSEVDGLVLVFDVLGNVSSFTYGNTTETNTADFKGVRLCLNGNPAASVCVSPAGYAHEGSCEQ
jgi:hypothetical protein